MSVTYELCKHKFYTYEFYGIAETVRLHGQAVITNSQDLLGHGMPTRIDSKGSYMDYFGQHVFLLPIHASEQNHVVVSLVKHIITQEEFGC